MKEIGLTTKLKAREYILIWMELSMKDIGKKTNNMEKERKYGQMELCMKGTMLKERSMVMVSLDGQMGHYTLVNFSIII